MGATHADASTDRLWYSTRDSNPHWTGSKPVASAIGLMEHMVGKVGLEPTRLAALDFESSTSADSITTPEKRTARARNKWEGEK